MTYTEVTRLTPRRVHVMVPVMAVPEFDEDGFLPPGRHFATVADVRTALVDGFPSSTRRGRLFASWLAHCEALEYLITLTSHWLGGSFTTSKAEPGDIDAVAFIDGPEFDSRPTPHRRLVKYMCSGHSAKPFWSCDVFSISVYPPDHPEHDRMKAAMAYWEDWWGHTREDAAGHRRPRGYLEVS